MPKPTQAGTETLKKKIAALPRGPGVYLLKDANGRVLYVGKAQDLRTRVRSYLHPEQDTRASAPFLSAKVTDVDFIATSNEKEALILEDTQIKRHRPRYNVKLRDDKAYLCIRVDLDHEWPRLGMVRRIKRDGAVYFGPFSDAKAVRRTLRTLGNVFPLRLCSDRTLVTRDRPCLYYQLQRCCAPCVDLVEQAEYQRMVKGLLDVLRGKVSGLLRSLERQMAAASQAQQYERAASLRDQIEAVRRTTQAQHVMSADLRDRDVVGLQRRGEVAVAMVLHVREGRLISKRGYPMRTLLPDGAILERVLGQIYRAGRLVPPEVLLPAELEDPQAAVERLRELRGGAVRLRVPQRGAGRALLDLAEQNALSALEHAEGDERQRQALLQALGDRLALAAVTQRIECYDISNLQGAEMVGSRAVFQDGLPDKESYRRFKIRSVQGQDDFAALREVLQRRFATAEVAPDLIVVDGGAGQLSGALERIPDGVAVVGLAKARTLRGGKRLLERVYLPGRREPLELPPDAPETYLLARIRDEAHRFAITYHRKLRSRRAIRSQLDGIPGLGPKRRTALLRMFGSAGGVRAAGAEELRKVPLPEPVVQAILAWAEGKSE